MAKKKSASKKRRKSLNKRSRKNRKLEKMEPLEYANLELRQLLATVTTPVDVVNPSDGLVSLREAVASTNASTSDNTINFSFSNQTIALEDQELLITDGLTINGNGNTILGDTDEEEVRVLNFSSNATDRGQSPASFNVLLNEVTISGGRTDGENDVEVPFNENFYSGGGIRFNSTGTLTIRNSEVSNNGAIDFGSKGGGVFAVGDVVLENSEITNNYTGLDKFFGDSGELGSGGGVFSESSLSLSNTDVTNNRTFGYGAAGAGIASFGDITLDNGSLVSGNYTDGRYSDGGGVFAGGVRDLSGNSSYGGANVTLKGGSIVENNYTTTRFSKGGGISASGTVTLEPGSIVRNNRTEGRQSHGGGIYSGAEIIIDNATLMGNHTSGGTSKLAEVVCKVGVEVAKNVVGAALPGGRAIEIATTIYDHLSIVNEALGSRGFPSVDLDPCPEAFGSGGYGGGAAATRITVLNDSTISGNYTDGYGADGGALFARLSISIADSTVSGNETKDTFSSGGALHAVGGVSVQRSTIDNNHTRGNFSSGGAIASGFRTGAVTISNSSVTNNSTEGNDSEGGAIFSAGVLIIGSEVSDNNTSGRRSAGGAVFGENIVSVRDSVVSGNSTTGDTGSISITSASQSFFRTNQSGGGAIASVEVNSINSTFSNNFTSGDEADGGAIYGGTVVNATNSTFQGNRAAGEEAVGGGIRAFNANIYQSTLTGNTASDKGGAVRAANLKISNSIVLGNLALDLEEDDDTVSGNEISIGGTLTAQGSNIIGRPGNPSDSRFRRFVGDAPFSANASDVFLNTTFTSGTNGFGDFVSTTSGLLTDNLGLEISLKDDSAFTLQTVALEETATNPAIDASQNVNSIVTLTNGLQNEFGTDSRNFVRGFDFSGNSNNGGTVDLGAVEAIPLSALLTVTNNQDNGSGSLRAAIGAANLNPGTDTIRYEDEVFTTNLTSGEIEITESLVIDGDPFREARFSTIDAGGNSRIFNFTASSGDLVIRNLSLVNGQTTGDNDVNSDVFSGGAIRSTSTGTVKILNSYLRGNSTTGNRAAGGAIFARGNVEIDSSEVTANDTTSSSAGGGAVFADSVILRRSTIEDNTTQGSRSSGGAIFAVSNVTVYSTYFSINRTAGNDSSGGAISSRGDVKLGTNVLFDGNRTSGNSSSGGATFATGNLTADSVFAVNNYTSGGSAHGGAFAANRDVTLTNSVIEGNSTQRLNATGGGIYAGRDLEIVNSSIIANRTSGYSSEGGGIAVDGNATVTGSTISNNHTGGGNSEGGGIFVDGVLTLTSSTIAGNSTGDSNGDSDGGGISAVNASIADSIVIGNFSNDPTSPQHEIKTSGSLTFGGRNIVGENATDFNTTPFNSASVVVQNARTADIFTATDAANSVQRTRFDSNGDGVANQITSNYTGIPEFHGGDRLSSNAETFFKKTIALNPSVSNPALDGTIAPINLFSFEGNADDGFGGNNGTLEGDLTADAPALDGVSDNAINIGGDGTKYVQLANPLTVGDKSHTVETWIQVPEVGLEGLETGQRVGVILGNFGNSSFNANWEIHDDGQMRVFWRNGELSIFGTTDLRDGQWHHVAFVRDTVANEFRFYVDGVEEITTGFNSAGTDFTFNQPSRIGQDARGIDQGPPIAFHGSIDELTIHESALTEAQIRVRAGFDNRVSGVVESESVNEFEEQFFDRIVSPPGANSSPRLDIGAFESTAEVQSLQVTTLNDVVDPLDGFTSIREAIAFADSGDADGIDGDHDTITFSSDLGGGTLLLDNGELIVNDSLTIESSGTEPIIIDAANESRVVNFAASTGDLELSNLILTRGNTAGRGGAIYFDSTGDLTLTESRVRQSSAALGGGGIFVRGDAIVNESVIDGNQTSGSYGSGGGVLVFGDITVTNSTIYGNETRGPNSSGGGVFGLGNITTTNSAIVSNSSIFFGGGIVGSNEPITLNNSIVLDNNASTDEEISAPGSLVFGGHNIVGEDATSFDTTGESNVQNAAIEDVFETGRLTFNSGGLSQIVLNSAQQNPALDSGSNSLAPLTDALGNPRAVNLPAVDDRVNGNFVDLGPIEQTLTTEERPSLVVTTSSDDVNAFDLVTSLREAILYANQVDAGVFENGDADGDGDALDTITFASSLAGETITLGGSQLEISDSVTIDGLGVDQLTISGNDASRVFVIDDDNDNTEIDVTLRGLTIRDGNTTSGSSALTGRGAGIQNKENLTLEDVAVRSNRSDLVAGNVGSRGGGLAHSLGDLVVIASTFADNSSLDSGGIDIASGSVEIVNSTFYGNTVRGNGAAIRVEGDDTTVTIRNSTITGNTGDDNDNGSNQAGGIQRVGGSVTLHNTLVAGNFGGTDGEINDLAGTFSSASSNNLIGEQDSGVSLNNGTNGNIVGDGNGGALALASILTRRGYERNWIRRHFGVLLDRKQPGR